MKSSMPKVLARQKRGQDAQKQPVKLDSSPPKSVSVSEPPPLVSISGKRTSNDVSIAPAPRTQSGAIRANSNGTRVSLIAREQLLERLHSLKNELITGSNQKPALASTFHATPAPLVAASTAAPSVPVTAASVTAPARALAPVINGLVTSSPTAPTVVVPSAVSPTASATVSAVTPPVTTPQVMVSSPANGFTQQQQQQQQPTTPGSAYGGADAFAKLRMEHERHVSEIAAANEAILASVKQQYERQLASLQAKFDRFQESAEAEANRLVAREKDLQTSSNQQIAALQRENQQLADLVAQTQTASGHVLEELASLSAAKQAAEDTAQQRASELVASEARLQQSLERIATLEAECEQYGELEGWHLRDEVSRLTKELADAQTRYDTIVQEKDQLKTAIADADKLRHELETLRADNAALREALQQHTTDMQQHQQVLDDRARLRVAHTLLQQQYAALQQQVASNASPGTVQQLQQELKQARDELQTLQSKYEELQQQRQQEEAAHHEQLEIATQQSVRQALDELVAQQQVQNEQLLQRFQALEQDRARMFEEQLSSLLQLRVSSPVPADPLGPSSPTRPSPSVGTVRPPSPPPITLSSPAPMRNSIAVQTASPMVAPNAAPPSLVSVSSSPALAPKSPVPVPAPHHSPNVTTTTAAAARVAPASQQPSSEPSDWHARTEQVLTAMQTQHQEALAALEARMQKSYEEKVQQIAALVERVRTDGAVSAVRVPERSVSPSIDVHEEWQAGTPASLLSSSMVPKERGPKSILRQPSPVPQHQQRSAAASLNASPSALDFAGIPVEEWHSEYQTRTVPLTSSVSLMPEKHVQFDVLSLDKPSHRPPPPPTALSAPTSTAPYTTPVPRAAIPSAPASTHFYATTSTSTPASVQSAPPRPVQSAVVGPAVTAAPVSLRYATNASSLHIPVATAAMSMTTAPVTATVTSAPSSSAVASAPLSASSVATSLPTLTSRASTTTLPTPLAVPTRTVVAVASSTPAPPISLPLSSTPSTTSLNPLAQAALQRAQRSMKKQMDEFQLFMSGSQ